MELGQEAPKLREIYAYVGYAVFLAQTLEGLLNQAIFSFVIIPAKKSEIREIVAKESLAEWETLIDSHDEQLRRYTFGKLLSKLKDSGALRPNVEETLKDALAQRNYVAHQFFKDKLATLYSENGQDDAILYLRQAGYILQKAINLLFPLVQAEVERYGYDATYVEEFARSAIKEATKGL